MYLHSFHVSDPASEFLKNRAERDLAPFSFFASKEKTKKKILPPLKKAQKKLKYRKSLGEGASHPPVPSPTDLLP